MPGSATAVRAATGATSRTRSTAARWVGGLQLAVALDPLLGGQRVAACLPAVPTACLLQPPSLQPDPTAGACQQLHHSLCCASLCAAGCTHGLYVVACSPHHAVLFCPLLLQLRWIAAPMAYVMAVALGVGVYHSLADVSGVAVGVGCGAATGAAWCLLLCPWVPQSHYKYTTAAPPLPTHLASLPCPASCLQLGMLPHVLPQIKSGAAAPFGLTSFALSALLVLR